jgi:fucokinase
MAWDYLIITASNDRQASAYERQLRVRRDSGDLSQVREVMVIADFEGKRIGSGASTLDCLSRVIEMERRPGVSVEELLSGLRILILHAGGDSRRLPAYGPAGKIFVPLPGRTRSGAPMTLFDRLSPAFLSLNTGGIVVASGDALIDFDPSVLDLSAPGVTMTGCYAEPEDASRHGVLCGGTEDSLRLYLQKPTAATQAGAGAIGAGGKSILDIGVMSFGASAASSLLRVFHPLRETILNHGLDLYREICCAMGTDATVEHYAESVRRSGSTWDESPLAAIFPALHSIPAQVRIVPSCRFLHFGSTRQLIESGVALSGEARLCINNRIEPGGRIEGDRFWVEGCRIAAPLALAGNNAVIGVDVLEPLSLPPGGCLEVLAGRARDGSDVYFIRCYGINDSFKDPVFFGRPLPDWMGDAAGPSLWEARAFPAEKEPQAFRRWLWIFDLEHATPEQKRAFLTADRYSAAEIALVADQEKFHSRRDTGRSAG